MNIAAIIGLILIAVVVVLMIVRKVNPDRHDIGDVTGGGSGKWLGD